MCIHNVLSVACKPTYVVYDLDHKYVLRICVQKFILVGLGVSLKQVGPVNVNWNKEIHYYCNQAGYFLQLLRSSVGITRMTCWGKGRSYFDRVTSSCSYTSVTNFWE